MKFLILALLLFAQICGAVEVMWTAPTTRESGAPLKPEEICCYEILVRDKTTNKLLITHNIKSSGVSKYTFTFALPTNIVEANVRYQIAAIDGEIF